MHLQNLHLFCQDDGKPEGLLRRRRMCLCFSCSFSDVNGWFFHFRPPGGEHRPNSTEGQFTSWESLKMSNAASPQRTVGPSVRPCEKVKPARPHNSWKSVFSLRTLVQNTAGSQACAQTPFIYSSMLFLKRG